MLKEPATLLDSHERETALDVKRSFIVQAPAGSGKTELLIQRILNLLCYVKRPEEIVAITFTKKAANEMRLRLIQSFMLAKKDCPTNSHLEKTWRLAKKVLERDEIFGWGLLQNPNQFNIQTIDSLCSYLTRQLPLLSHFGGTPAITQNPSILYEKAIDALISHLDEDYPWVKKLEYLMLHLDNNLIKLKSLLTTLLAKRDQWIPYLHYTSNNNLAKKQLELYLQYFIEEKLKNIHKLFPEELLAQISLLAFYCSQNLTQEGLNNFLNGFIDPSPPRASFSDLNKWQGIATLVLTKEGEIRKKVTKDHGFLPLATYKNPEEKAKHSVLKEEFFTILDKLSDNKLLQEALHFLQSLPNTNYSPHQWKILYSLLEILKVLLAELRLTFIESGQIDFIENTQAALQALGDEDNPTNLTLALDYQFKHI